MGKVFMVYSEWEMMDMKKYLTVLLAILLCLTGTGCAFAEGSGTDSAAVTAEELAAWAAELRERARETEPENDPADEAADVEGGILFVYPFASLYADRTEMTADTRINAVSLSETDAVSFRNVVLHLAPGDLISLFPNDNPELAGDREGAVLYIREREDGALRYGRVYRDGQRVSAVEYGDLVPTEDVFYLSTLTCFFADGLLYEVRAEGTDPDAAPRMTGLERDEFAAELHDLAAKTAYRSVKSGRNGAGLDVFGPEDLVFSGIDFLALQPEDLPGTPESEVFDNGDGTSLIRVDGDGYIAVFRGAAGETEIVSLSIEDDVLEGPRCVRLGDAFHEDLQRFRSEDRGGDGAIEILYGGENEVPRGLMENGPDGLVLRYVTEADGREVELLLRYTLSRLSEIILHVQ